MTLTSDSLGMLVIGLVECGKDSPEGGVQQERGYFSNLSEKLNMNGIKMRGWI